MPPECDSRIANAAATEIEPVMRPQIYFPGPWLSEMPDFHGTRVCKRLPEEMSADPRRLRQPRSGTDRTKDGNPDIA